MASDDTLVLGMDSRYPWRPSGPRPLPESTIVASGHVLVMHIRSIDHRRHDQRKRELQA